MARNPRKAPHRRKRADPLVPISGARLDQARRLGRWSLRSIATALKRRRVVVAWQTITYVEAGTQQRVRATLFDALVTLLRGPWPEDVFRAWLRGEDVELAPAPADPAAIRSLGLRRLAAQSDSPGLIAPLAGLVVGRDALELRARAIAERPARARAESWHEVTVTGRTQHLYDPGVWRSVLLGDDAPPATPDERDAATEHLSAFLRIALAPWLDGRARFHRDARARAVAFLGRLLGPVP